MKIRSYPMSALCATILTYSSSISLCVETYNTQITGGLVWESAMVGTAVLNKSLE
jgi:hypothetical protein